MCPAARKGEPGRDHQAGAGDQQVAQVMARREEADRERQQRGAEQRRGRHQPDLERRIAERRQIGRQDDDREPVAETAHAARRIEMDR